ncbi:hypothetical protein ONA24_00395 [Mycoplasmopsis cynos]|uniref:hypothetical protein n=1 Tax=Mycoplasmopsis cynos TaxID=171284 RepID=UPI0024C7E016|nr:hypothetical protein [Mycoplasmopsis cynos]WAM09815.1 hypothetical protein ONA24_00395 [Mycoplasmopsis cynos]
MSSCQNIYAKKTEPKNVEPKKVKTMSLQNKWIISTAKDFVKDYKPGNLENQIHTDDVTFSKYQEVPYFIYEAFKDLLFGQNSNGRYRVIPYDKANQFRKHFNIVNEDYKEDEINFKNVFDEKAFNYLQSFIKLKDEKKVELNNVNKDSFKDKVARLKKDKWVYSKTQDYISKTQDTRLYDFENQRNSYLDNFYNTEIVRSGLIEPVTINLYDIDYKFVLLINDWETKYQDMLKQGKPITLEMLKDWFKIYYDYYKIQNQIDNNKNKDEGYSLLNVDKVSAIFNKQKKEYDHNFLNAYDYKTDAFKDAKYSFSKDDYEIRIQKNNEFNQGSKLRFSTNINAKNNLATRNVQLFKDNTSQGSLTLIDKDFQAYIVTSRHSLYQRLVKYYNTKKLDKYEKNDTSSKNTYFTTKTTYSDLFTTNEAKRRFCKRNFISSANYVW